MGNCDVHKNIKLNLSENVPIFLPVKILVGEYSAKKTFVNYKNESNCCIVLLQ